MNVTRHTSAVKPGWERLRADGKYVRDPGKVKATKHQPLRHSLVYAELRAAALRLTRHLETMMPQATMDGSAEPAIPPSPEFERLLGRSDGVIDGFNTLALLVIRLIDKERESRGKRPSRSSSRVDDQELDRRIFKELDLIAERRRGEKRLQDDSRQPTSEEGGPVELEPAIAN